MTYNCNSGDPTMPLETLRTLDEFLDPRPGLTVAFGKLDGQIVILAMRAGEFVGSRFIHRTSAELEEGELTRALNEIAEALEAHDEQYDFASRGFRNPSRVG
jgi:hypothetical protein